LLREFLHGAGTFLHPVFNYSAKAANMSFIDWVILALYCVGILALAWCFHSRASRGVEQFFIADRNLPWWVIGLADVAGYTGGGQTFVMVIFLFGFAGLWLMAWISWIIWMPLVAIIWAPMWRRLGVVTTGEFIEKRYAGRRARAYRNVYALYGCFVWGVTSIAYSAAWMAATISSVLNWSPINVLVVFGALTIVYSLMAGLFAVVYNDVMQFAILIGANLVFGCLLVSKAGGMHSVWAKVSLLRGNQFLSAFPSGGSLTALSIVALCVQGLFFAGSPYAGEGWTAQRFMAARNEWHAVVGQITNGILALAVRLVPFILIAFAAAALFPVAQVPAPAALWGELVRAQAPPGLFGLLLVSGLAGSMAAISSIGNWAASFVVNDIYRRSLRPHASQREFVLASRVVSGLLLVIAFAWGAMIDPKQLEKWILFINSSLIVFSLPLAWLKWFWWRTNAVGDMVGVLGGFPAGYVVWFGSDAVLPAGFRAWTHNLTGLNLNGLVPAFSNLQRYPFWVGFGILFGLGWICILLSTLLTRPEPMETLRSFYMTAKPIGLWGPVRRCLDPAVQEAIHPEMGRDLLSSALGILFYCGLTVSLFSLLGGQLRQGLIALALAVLCGILFGKTAISRLKWMGTSISIPESVHIESREFDL
jgi:Na+/proline symporter